MTSNKKLNDTSKLKKIANPAKKHKTKLQLIQEICTLKQKNKELLEEIERLVEQPEEQATEIVLSSEEVIAGFQLNKLSKIAYERDLTLEEARKFEIFTKVKQAAIKDRPVVPKYKELPEKITEQTLLSIATGKTNTDV